MKPVEELSDQWPIVECQQPLLMKLIPSHFGPAETDAGSREYVMDSEFRWAQDNYSSTRRTVEIWAFIVRLRVTLTLIDQKWSYVGGFSEEKCASF